MKKLGIVSGKFRIFHKGHKDVILKASKYDIDKLIVIIHDQKNIKRYSTIKELENTIHNVLKNEKIEYEIVYTSKEFKNFDIWEDYILEKFEGWDILMFNSKENYKNIKLKNTFINCDVPLTMSASNIEESPFSKENSNYIAEEFKPFLKRRVNLFINTSYSKIEMFLFDSNFKKLYVKNSKNNHTIKLYELFLEVVKEGYLFDKIYIVNGPGSYTGTRVGVIFAKTLAYEKNIDIYPVNLLELIYKSTGSNVALDARGGSYFCYDGKEFSLKKEEDIKEYKKDLEIDYNNIIEFLSSKKKEEVKKIKINYLKEVL